MSDAETLSISPATGADVAELHRLVESAYRGESAKAGWTNEADLLSTPRTSAEELAAMAASPDEVMLLARRGGRLIGCVHVARRPEASAYLGMLTVDPTLQAGGLGKRLMAAAEAEAAARFGARTMELTVISRRAELVAYYERRGYARTGEERPFPVAVEPPLVLAVMRKPIAAERA
ncbi:GNAT family N-acetyltransferase [Phenylobacterium sp.]|uniref:GNAT family N-acetyltransferase n=1 Tax=Phenylobacterium sp. TaxID=1871053 RepID=UPI0035B42988